MITLDSQTYQTWKASQKPCDEGLAFCPCATVNETPKRWALTALLESSSLPWANALKALYAHEMSFPGSISPTAGEMLRTLVLNIAPVNVVEIGCFMGASTLWMASALQELRGTRQLHSIDLFHAHGPNDFTQTVLEKPLAYVQEKVNQSGFTDLVNLHAGDSKILADQVGQTVPSIEFLFIDGDHTVEGCYADFMIMEKYVATGGYILLHDIFPEWCGWEGPRLLLDTVIKNNPRFEYIQLYISPLNFGYGLIRKLA